MNIHSETEREIEKFIDSMPGRIAFMLLPRRNFENLLIELRQSLLAISKKTYEAVRVEEVYSEDSYNKAVQEQKSNAQAWFGEEV